jgi:tRNA (guanosine-2'-O-)-methyltransferase
VNARRAIPHAEVLTPERRERIERVVAGRTRELLCAVEEVHDPHNLSAVVRTCEGLGLQELHAVPEKATGFRLHRKVTQDADKWVDVKQHRTIAALLADLRTRGYRVYGASVGASAQSLYELDFTRRACLLFGNEHRGLSAAALAGCDALFVIPMRGFTRSFNISVAAAISLSWAVEARRRAEAPDGLAAEDAASLRERFYALATGLEWKRDARRRKGDK